MKRFCPNCGEAQPLEAAFCANCGFALTLPLSAAGYDDPPQPRPRRRLAWVVAVGAILVVALAGAGLYLLWPALTDRAGRPPDPSLSNGDKPAAEVAEEPSQPETTPNEPEPASTATPLTGPLPTTPPPPTKTLTPTTAATVPPTKTSTPSVTPTITQTPTPGLGPETIIIGYSVENRPIEAVRFGLGPRNVVLIGGLHAGFAPGSVSLAQRVVQHFTANPQAVPSSVTLYVVPSANPDSILDPGKLVGRLNANGVDLNRNWNCRWREDATFDGRTIAGLGGPEPFSEPESRAGRDFLLEKQPVAVVFWEARAVGGLASPGGCGEPSAASQELAELYGRAADYAIASFEELTNQLLNGDASNWLDQQGIPAVAILLPDYSAIDWNRNLAGVLAVINALRN